MNNGDPFVCKLLHVEKAVVYVFYFWVSFHVVGLLGG